VWNFTGLDILGSLLEFLLYIIDLTDYLKKRVRLKCGTERMGLKCGTERMGLKCGTERMELKCGMERI
jgi:hypothetical protein